MGVTHHSVYPVWFEMGRTELLRSTGISYRELEEEGVFLAVVRLDVRYRQPARYDDDLVLDCVSFVRCDGIVCTRYSHRWHGQ